MLDKAILIRSSQLIHLDHHYGVIIGGVHRDHTVLELGQLLLIVGKSNGMPHQFFLLVEGLGGGYIELPRL